MCPCGVSEEDCGQKWLSHTTTCVAWIAKRRRLLEPVPVGEPTSTEQIDQAQIPQPNIPPTGSEAVPATEHDLGVDQVSSESNTRPMVIAKEGLRMTIRLPPSLRLPLEAVNVPPSGPELMETQITD
ncbi:hypothetical protein FRC12_011021 [Ceratobasidium sp. 428]|nr:hypothetical protein FRC12_011021 [Ceratobasidium sp. 428]